MVQFTVMPGAVVFVKDEIADLTYFRNKLRCLDSIWVGNTSHEDEMEKVGSYTNFLLLRLLRHLEVQEKMFGHFCYVTFLTVSLLKIRKVRLGKG